MIKGGLEARGREGEMRTESRGSGVLAVRKDLRQKECVVLGPRAGPSVVCLGKKTSLGGQGGGGGWEQMGAEVSSILK